MQRRPFVSPLIAIRARQHRSALTPTEEMLWAHLRGCHAQRRHLDARRDRQLLSMGYRTLRLEADLIRHNLPAALAQIRSALE